MWKKEESGEGGEEGGKREKEGRREREGGRVGGTVVNLRAKKVPT